MTRDALLGVVADKVTGVSLTMSGRCSFFSVLNLVLSFESGLACHGVMKGVSMSARCERNWVLGVLDDETFPFQADRIRL